MVRVPSWSPAHRLGQRPGAELAAFGALVEGDVDDLEDVLEVLAATDPRYRDALGRFRAYPASEQYQGTGAAVVMMPFLFPNESRFSAGFFGLLYGAESGETAGDELAYHSARWLHATKAPPGTMILLAHWRFTFEPDLVDLRTGDGEAAIHDPDGYDMARKYGRKLRSDGAPGVLYRSVRRPGGECIGIFRPSAVRAMEKAEHWRFIWDGSSIVERLRT